MPRADSERRIVRLRDLEPGDGGDCFALLVKKDLGKTRDGKPYYRAQFRDAGRSATAMIWADGGWFEDCAQHWQPGAFYKLRVRYFENQYGAGIELERIRPIEPEDTAAGFDPTEYSPRSQRPPQEMFDELVAIAEAEIDDPQVRQLTIGILREREPILLTLAAAVHHHHAYVGGFVEHVLSVVRNACFLADKYRDLYPELLLSKALVVAGAILHDIGKTVELEQRPTGAEFTPSGRLIGHIVLGRDLVRDAARAIEGFDPETLLRLEHLILSHQGTPEWGSPVPPSTPEALLVHYADDIDAKFQMLAQALTAPIVAGQETFTGRDNPLQRRLFRGLPTDPKESP